MPFQLTGTSRVPNKKERFGKKFGAAQREHMWHNVKCRVTHIERITLSSLQLYTAAKFSVFMILGRSIDFVYCTESVN